jgi:hypothetical protein
MYFQKVADLLRFSLACTRTDAEIGRDLARGDVGCLRGIEEKVHHTERVYDATCPGVGLTASQRRKSFSTERRRQLAAELRILLVQVLLAEGVSEPGDLVETCLHFFGHILRCAAFSHIYLLSTILITAY